MTFTVTIPHLILAIDPGTTESGWVQLANGQPAASGKTENGALLEMVGECLAFDMLAIEMVASYGMAVGEEVFRTVWWTGRFAEAWWAGGNGLPREIKRKAVCLHLCNSPRANDSNVRQALIDRWGGKAAAIGNARAPGPLHAVKGDAWQALGVAVTALETQP